MRNMTIAIALATALGFAAGANAEQSGVSASADQRVMVTEAKFRPPHKRAFMNESEVDLARFEIAEQVPVVRGTVFRGRPMFRRNVEKLESVDLARFELTDENLKARMERRAPHHKR